VLNFVEFKKSWRKSRTLKKQLSKGVINTGVGFNFFAVLDFFVVSPLGSLAWLIPKSLPLLRRNEPM